MSSCGSKSSTEHKYYISTNTGRSFITNDYKIKGNCVYFQLDNKDSVTICGNYYIKQNPKYH